MYEKHFGFSRKPFENTPDPAFFFTSPQHEEALSNLFYATTQRKGFVLLTGEVGAGKTVMSRILIERLGKNVKFAHITNTHITPRGIAYEICKEFGLDFPKTASKTQLLSFFNDFLIEQLRTDGLVVLLIDEAQNLSDRSMEEVRMLSNLETNSQKLIQIVIIGQPELRKRIFSSNLKQLRQRIAVSFHLRPLSGEQTCAYVTHRLNVVQTDRRVIFGKAALALIARYSGGTPRVINAICDCCLVLAYARNLQCVPEELIEEVVRNHLPIDPDLQDGGSGEIRIHAETTAREERTSHEPEVRHLRRWMS